MSGLSDLEFSRAKTNPELRESLHSRVLGKMTGCDILSDGFLDLQHSLHALEEFRTTDEWHDVTRA